MTMLSLRVMGSCNVELSLGQNYAFKVSDLDVLPDDLTIYRGHVLVKWTPPASMSSLSAMGAGNVEFSLGQAFHVQSHFDLGL